MVPFPLTLRGDIAMLNERMARYATALRLEPREVVKMQAGILARELAEGSAPRSKEALEKSIDRDIGKVYSPAPKQMLPMRHRQGKGFVWLMATPWNVTGVKPWDYHMEDSISDLERQFYKTKPRAERYQELGPRKQTLSSLVFRIAGQGKSPQQFRRLNRIVVKRGVFKEFKANQKRRAGILGGSWAIAWPLLQPKGRKPPAYKFRHVGNGTARGTYIDGLGVPGHASFSLVNRATGCTKPSQLEMVRGKIRYRSEAMTVDLKNLLRGAYKRAGFKRS